jgi:hypothetical protein
LELKESLFEELMLVSVTFTIVLFVVSDVKLVLFVGSLVELAVALPAVLFVGSLVELAVALPPVLFVQLPPLIIYPASQDVQIPLLLQLKHPLIELQDLQELLNR